MRLRNKKTGEIKEVIVGGCPVSGKTKMWECSEMDANEETGYKTLGTYNSLAELNEEWEDYEEPKNPYFINWFGEVSELLGHISDREIEKLKEAGDYFETKEEAEKAAEKLKAWKRLEDKGFFFDGRTTVHDNTVKIRARVGVPFLTDELTNDLDLLFGGEE